MKNLILLLMILIIFPSCQTTAVLNHETEQCSPQFVFVEGSSNLIDAKESKCLCRKYKFSPVFIGPLNSATEKDISYCNKLVGHTPRNYVNLFLYWDAIRIDYLKGE